MVIGNIVLVTILGIKLFYLVLLQPSWVMGNSGRFKGLSPLFEIVRDPNVCRVSWKWGTKGWIFHKEDCQIRLVWIDSSQKFGVLDNLRWVSLQDVPERVIQIYVEPSGTLTDMRWQKWSARFLKLITSNPEWMALWEDAFIKWYIHSHAHVWLPKLDCRLSVGDGSFWQLNNLTRLLQYVKSRQFQNCVIDEIEEKKFLVRMR